MLHESFPNDSHPTIFYLSPIRPFRFCGVGFIPFTQGLGPVFPSVHFLWCSVDPCYFCLLILAQQSSQRDQSMLPSINTTSIFFLTGPLCLSHLNPWPSQKNLSVLLCNQICCLQPSSDYFTSPLTTAGWQAHGPLQPIKRRLPHSMTIGPPL